MRHHRSNAYSDSHRWFRPTTAVVLIAAVIISVSTAVAVSALRIGFTPVLTDSMSPTLEAGSVAITRQKLTDNLDVGDVVILPLPENEGQRYMHRLIEVEHFGSETHVRTKGDRNPLPDPWTLQVTSSTAPVAIGSIPYLGWTTNVLRWTIVRLLFAGLIMALVIIGLLRIRRQMSRTHRSNVIVNSSKELEADTPYAPTHSRPTDVENLLA
jgi:signal peptidase